MKLSDYVISFLADRGVRHVFMLPGGGAMHLNDSLGREPRLTYICNLHEQACAVAAEAYAQYTNEPGVAMVTTGPGGTNAITGVAAAWLDSTPCLFLSGQVKRADSARAYGVRQLGFQEIDIVALVSPITKYAVTVNDPQRIGHELEKAWHLARSGRPGPVWVDIPLDVQAADIDPERLAPFVPEATQGPSRKGLEQLARETIARLNAAERPVILAGNGVRLARAIPELLHFAEAFSIPLLTTWKALDFLPESHPLFAGRPGAVGQRGANFAQQNSDWLLAIGARLDYGQTGYVHEYFARGAAKVVVDIDGTEIKKLKMKVDVGVEADAGAFLRTLLAMREEIVPRDRRPWLDRCQQWKQRYPVVQPAYRDVEGSVHPYVLVDELSELLGKDDLLVPGSSGACSEITMQAFREPAGLRVLNSEGLGPMGFGVPAALGACVASGGKRTICIDGDGGFQMNAQELETIRRLDLPIKFFVLDNGGYGSIRATQRNYFNSRFVASDPSGGLTLPDVVAVAAGYGVPTAILDHQRDLRARLRELLDAKGPLVCRVKVSPDVPTMPKLSSAQRADGTMMSKPLEDLWPFLDRAEFLANMIVPPVEDEPPAPKARG